MGHHPRLADRHGRSTVVTRMSEVVIVDDRLGRRHADRLGPNLNNTFGVVHAAKKVGLLAEIAPQLDQLAENRISSPKLCALASQAGEHPLLA